MLRRPRAVLSLTLLALACAAPQGTVVVLKSGQELHGDVRAVDNGVIDLVAPDGDEEPVARQHVTVVEGDGPFADPPILWREIPAVSGPRDETGPDATPPASWIRAGTKDGHGSLDVGVGAFEREDGRRVYLVGAVHVAHPDTFAAQQAVLDSMDLVLWEGVGAKEKPDPAAMERFDVLFKTQVLLKNILNLDFQLDRIDYKRPFWRNSDVGINELQAELDERNLTIIPNEALFRGVFGTLFKVIDPAKIPRSEETGRTYRGMVAPLMADTERLFRQAGAEGLEEVLIKMRNRRVMDDLAAVLAAPDAPRRIGIYYGAAHFPNMAWILVGEMGFKFVGVHWIEAWRY